jgi:hypothetical protein
MPLSGGCCPKAGVEPKLAVRRCDHVRACFGTKLILVSASYNWGVVTMTDQVLTNQKTLLANQAEILKNQVSMLKNQEEIRNNQKTMLKNQDKILSNQEKMMAHVLGKQTA